MWLSNRFISAVVNFSCSLSIDSLLGLFSFSTEMGAPTTVLIGRRRGIIPNVSWKNPRPMKQTGAIPVTPFINSWKVIKLVLETLNLEFNKLYLKASQQSLWVIIWLLVNLNFAERKNWHQTGSCFQCHFNETFSRFQYDLIISGA